MNEHTAVEHEDITDEEKSTEPGFRTVTYTSPGFDTGAEDTEDTEDREDAEDREDREDTVTGSHTETQAEAQADKQAEAETEAGFGPSHYTEPEPETESEAGFGSSSYTEAETEAETGFDSDSDSDSDFATATATNTEAQTESPAAAADTVAEPLLGAASAEAFIDRWSSVQATFVEDPHRSVTEADTLLTEVLTAYQQAIEQRRAQIAGSGAGSTGGTDSAGSAPDTEGLRLALLEYRSIITAMVGV
ncbi:hypothetical protein ABIA31_008390 [Catenulispora sp. MAP5-51]|uniref:hypothetical protein n=1 Tax=Catenulispora sp. MAP5-51 TaxID=3156298 RepID=UPI0035163157